MHSLIINIDKDRIITQDMKYESRHWPIISWSLRFRNHSRFGPQIKIIKPSLMDLCFGNEIIISFVWFIGTPWKSAMILGIRIAGTNRDFFVARDAHPFSVSLLRKPLDERSNMCDVKKNRGLCFLCALLLLALSYFYATWKKKHPKMTAFWDRWWFLHPENKKNLCIPIVFLGVRLHVWYIAHLSIKGSISRRFVSITSTLCMTAWFYFVCIWHRYFSDVHHDLLSCSVHIVDGYMSSLSHNDVCGYSKSFVPCCISSVPTSYIKATHSSSVRHKTCGHFSFGNQTKWFRIPESSKNILKFRKR